MDMMEKLKAKGLLPQTTPFDPENSPIMKLGRAGLAGVESAAKGEELYQTVEAMKAQLQPQAPEAPQGEELFRYIMEQKMPKSTMALDLWKSMIGRDRAVSALPEKLGGLATEFVADPSNLLPGKLAAGLAMPMVAGTVGKIAKKIAQSAPKLSRSLDSINSDYLKALQNQDYKQAQALLDQSKGIKRELKDWSIERGGAHSPPGPEEGAPAWDVVGAYPKDVYGPEGLRFYSTGAEGSMDSEALSVIRRLHGNPDRQVTIYRAVPKDSTVSSIQPGDWVTTVRDYAKEHGESSLGGKYKIQKKLVTARDLFTDGNSWLEWGYHPQKPVGKIAIKKEDGQLKTLIDRARQDDDGR